MNPNDFTLEELLAEQQRRKISKTPQTVQTQQSQIQQPDLSSLVKKPSPINMVGNFMQRLTGNEPKAPETDLYQKYLETALGEQAKSLYRDPLELEDLKTKIQSRKAGYTLDESGNPVKAVTPGQEDREKRLKDFESRRQAGSLRGELNQNTYIKRFQEMNSAATGIDSILQDTLARPDLQSKNVGDQALITLYNKILDPLSVVRESEYARTPEGQSLMNRIQGFVEKVKAGGSGLTDMDRMEIARAAKVLINNSGELYNSKISEYENLAGIYDVDPNMVVGGYNKFQPYNIDQMTQQQVVPQQSNQPTQPQDNSIPVVGGMFNGQKVKRVTKIG